MFYNIGARTVMARGLGVRLIRVNTVVCCMCIDAWLSKAVAGASSWQNYKSRGSSQGFTIAYTLHQCIVPVLC